MDVLTSETCRALNKVIKKTSGIKLVSLYSTIKMMHGPINIRISRHISVLPASEEGLIGIKSIEDTVAIFSLLRHMPSSMYVRSALFWVVTPRRMVVPYRHFGTIYRSHRQGSRSPNKSP